ncbi:hypothetical protein [Lichenifustis flavocetrariae]|uniref:Uncharacterized protein n=1 Tax=Lichenifustis flavocetrariae TaxID=2949735 RepID=A0AA41YTS5_9HYPH|nr:hypothetical protein [Lichenifustis flavocetrariae]MCW6507076.1 hypothetical protein [Lichenifustis flavocetrariae]
MDDFIAIAEAEEQRLTEELSRNPTFLKLQAVRAVLEAYRAASKPSVLDTMIKTFGPSGPRPGSKAAQIRPIVIEYLTKKNARAQTSELLEVVTRAGVEIGGQKPSGTMSSYLSNMDELDHKQGEGYGLKRPAPETPPPAPPAATSTEDGGPAPQRYTGGVFGQPGHDQGSDGERATEPDPQAYEAAEAEIFR